VWVTAAVVFMLVPWITVGFGTPLLFVTAALRRRHAGLASAGGLWASAAVYTAAVVALFHPYPANAMPPLLRACVVVLTIGAGTHAAVFAVLAALNTDHQDAGRCDRPVSAATHHAGGAHLVTAPRCTPPRGAALHSRPSREELEEDSWAQMLSSALGQREPEV
jgi:hypothetical protein